MKRQIRESMWESASSSIHSLVINPKYLCPNKLKMKDGYVITDFGSFGTEKRLYKTQNAKLSYLMTEVYYINHYSTEGIEDTYQFRHIEEAIMNYDKSVKGIKLVKKKEAYIDHQSIPEYGDSNFVNYWDKDSILGFLFDDSRWLKTDCD